jgi:FkbM family methyltransferase
MYKKTNLIKSKVKNTFLKKKKIKANNCHSISLHIIIYSLSLIILYEFIQIYKKNKYMRNLMIELTEYRAYFKLRNFTSYSQMHEDLILYSFFFDVEQGFYIDIGANDPNEISVSKAFYKLGWNGINIEPLPDKFSKLQEARKRDINLNLVVGDTKGKTRMRAIGCGSHVVGDRTKDSKNIIDVYMETMANICKQYIPKKKEIHFCKIDVEGHEKNVLLGYDFKNYRPKVFCIESTYPGTFKPCHHLWEYILLENDYSFVYKHGMNRYYVDNRIKDLKERINYFDNFIKKKRKFT